MPANIQPLTSAFQTSSVSDYDVSNTGIHLEVFYGKGRVDSQDGLADKGTCWQV